MFSKYDKSGLDVINVTSQKCHYVNVTLNFIVNFSI